MTGRALGRGPFLFAVGTEVQTRTGVYPMTRFIERFESAADTVVLASLLIGLPVALAASILASF